MAEVKIEIQGIKYSFRHLPNAAAEAVLTFTRDMQKYLKGRRN